MIMAENVDFSFLNMEIWKTKHLKTLVIKGLE